MQVQEENLQQAQIVAKQAEQIEAVNKDLQDTQKLLAALQSRSCTTSFAILPFIYNQCLLNVCAHPCMHGKAFN